MPSNRIFCQVNSLYCNLVAIYFVPVLTFLLTEYSVLARVLTVEDVMTNQAEIKYEVVDSQTGYVVGTYSSRKLASRKADKLDLEYGAIRYSVRQRTQGQ